MNLFKQSRTFVIWFAQVMRTFLQVHPWITAGVVAMAVASRMAYVLATFMPFKVVLLAGSSGVPRYFQFFMAPEHKGAWIIVLAVGTVVCYITSVVLDALTERLSETGSAKVLQEAEVIPFLNKQQDVARGYYAKLCRITADAIFILAGLLAGLIVNYWLFIVVISLICLLFVVSAILLKTSDYIHPKAAAVYIQNNLGNYVKTLTSIAFLISFLFLLILFLVFGYANVLGAILSIVIIRQTLTALTAIVKDAVSLGKAQHQINALTFRDVQFQQKENPIEKTHRELFHKHNRQELVRQELDRVTKPPSKLEVSWMDSSIPGVDTFLIAGQSNPSGDTHYLLQQVFPPKQHQRLDHELFLFQHIPRRQLMAPEQVSLFFAGPFQCQICYYGTGIPVPSAEWPDTELNLIEHIWSCPPPEELVRVYSASTPRLFDRISDEFVQKLDIAVDTDGEKDAMQRFFSQLPKIRKRLQSLPLYVYNPDLNLNNVVCGGENGHLILTWTRWSLEPLGTGISPRMQANGLEGLLAKVRSTRKDVPDYVTTEDLHVAAWCFDLENKIKKKKYKSALQLVGKILESK